MKIFNACVDQAPMVINLACYIICNFCQSQGMPKLMDVMSKQKILFTRYAKINGCDVQTEDFVWVAFASLCLSIPYMKVKQLILQ
jgi:hypothetical protein